jgi:putative endonuclease
MRGDSEGFAGAVVNEGGSPCVALCGAGRALLKTGMKHVYLIRSVSNQKRTYVGVTEDLQRRLSEHNQGKSEHTARFLPWELEVSVQFKDPLKADRFESYLKSGSGHAFAKRHFW